MLVICLIRTRVGPLSPGRATVAGNVGRRQASPRCLIWWCGCLSTRSSSTCGGATGSDARRHIASTANGTGGSPPTVFASRRFQGAGPTGWMRPGARIGVAVIELGAARPPARRAAGRAQPSDRSGALRRRTLLRTGRARFRASGSSKPWWLAGGVAVEVDETGCSGVRGGCVPDDVDRLASGGQPLLPFAWGLWAV